MCFLGSSERRLRYGAKETGSLRSKEIKWEFGNRDERRKQRGWFTHVGSIIVEPQTSMMLEEFDLGGSNGVWQAVLRNLGLLVSDPMLFLHRTLECWMLTTLSSMQPGSCNPQFRSSFSSFFPKRRGKFWSGGSLTLRLRARAARKIRRRCPSVDHLSNNRLTLKP